ncbi:MAG TPA: HAMP domain-containing sensor histidine kinase [Terracidiphilus sp.]|jgi:signal transduction histidine kinase|nr:HAMP domain-containing sensor histidine kinase [Terracidiphilus sp.]
MSSKTDRSILRSAAWRISLWAALAFTCGTMVVFIFIDRFVASDIQRRSDAWLSGELEVLRDVAEHTPNDALYNRVVGEVAELASREVPNRMPQQEDANDSVFFLQTGRDGSLKLWVGSGDGAAQLEAIQARPLVFDRPSSIRIRGFALPYRVASVAMNDGGRVYLGLSERDELRVLRNLRTRFFVLWLSLVLLGFTIVFFTSRRTLRHVRGITEAASRIGQSDLKTRVPTSLRHDEISQLAVTLNRMLDRIESTVHQLHTITDSLAHDLRSPLTAIRGKLESSLAHTENDQQMEPIVAAIDELDRLTDFLNKSLDVAEAKADALRLSPKEIDLDELLRAMAALYEPSMTEKGLRIRVESRGPVCITGDEGLIHRMIANLFDNELKHLPASSSVNVRLEPSEDEVRLILRDDGNGFDPEVRPYLFARRVKGRNSSGHGLGLAFVDAVVRAHAGTIVAQNVEPRGAQIIITLPLALVDVARSRAAAAG